MIRKDAASPVRGKPTRTPPLKATAWDGQSVDQCSQPASKERFFLGRHVAPPRKGRAVVEGGGRRPDPPRLCGETAVFCKRARAALSETQSIINDEGRDAGGEAHARQRAWRRCSTRCHNHHLYEETAGAGGRSAAVQTAKCYFNWRRWRSKLGSCGREGCQFKVSAATWYSQAGSSGSSGRRSRSTRRKHTHHPAALD